MIDLDALCEELNGVLPTSGWPLVRPIQSRMSRNEGRYAAVIWDHPVDHLVSIALQIYERRRSPILILVETGHSCGTIEPHKVSAAGIVAALNEYRWVME